jgi:large subunit ribosomal protein L9e
MKDLSSVESITVPEGVTVTVKARTVTVEGPRGTLTKNAGHIQLDIQLVSRSARLAWDGSWDGM